MDGRRRLLQGRQAFERHVAEEGLSQVDGFTAPRLATDGLANEAPGAASRPATSAGGHRAKNTRAVSGCAGRFVLSADTLDKHDRLRLDGLLAAEVAELFVGFALDVHGIG